MTNRSGRAWVFASLALALAACGSSDDRSQRSALPIPGLGDREANSTEIGVNSFLWRAALDTIEFMPLESADPYGGVILTDWYGNPEVRDERFKASIYILDSRLRADALNVNVFRQVYDPSLGWIDAATDPATEIQIENAILSRARQLRIGTLN